MSFVAPFALFAALAVPAIVALHLFRRRLRERAVAGLFLWAPRGLRAAAGRRRTRLIQSASLWLESLAALALALWLAGLDFGADTEARHVVLVLDDSGSMQAVVADDGERAVDRARTFATGVLDDATSNTRVTVIASGRRPVVLAGPRGLVADARAALADWEPTRPAHDLGAAVDLAASTVGTEAADVWVLTDALGELEVPDSFGVRAFGVARPNAALLHARRALGRDGKEHLFADVIAFGGAPRRGELRIAAAAERGAASGPPLVVQAFDIAPGRPARLDVPVESEGAWDVRLVVDGDALALDDGGVLLPEPRPRLRVASTLGAETDALLELDRLIAAVGGASRVDAAGAAELTFTTEPGAISAARHQVVVATPGEERDPWIGPYLVDRRHPVVEGVSLDGVVWTAGRGRLPGVPLVLAGQQALFSEERSLGGGLRFRLNLDPSATNLASAPDWPILFDGICRRVRAALPGAERHNVAIGDLIEWRLAAPLREDEALVLVGPDGARRPARGGRLLAWDVHELGLHVLYDGADREVARFAARFIDAAESDLSTRDRGVAEPAAPVAGEAEVGGAADFERRVLALLVLALVVMDWWILGRGTRT